MRVYIASYSSGIYLYDLDPESGALTHLNTSENDNQSYFLARHPSLPVMYVSGVVAAVEGGSATAVSAYTIDEDSGCLSLLNRPSSPTGCCHLAVDATGRSLVVADYGGGAAAVLPLDPDGRAGEPTAFVEHSGDPGPNTERQEEPHPHSAVVSPDNRFCFVPDLGLDRIVSYRLDAEHGRWTPNEPAFLAAQPGAGPRHFTFHPTRKYAYYNGELDGTVTACAYDVEAGELTAMNTESTLPSGFDGKNGTADVRTDPSGRFLYVTNRGHDSIAMFSIDPDSGRISGLGTVPSGGQTPQNLGPHPNGKVLLVANMGGDNVTAFHIDPDTGMLSPTGEVAAIPEPTCILM